MKIFNSLSLKKETFKPFKPPRVGMYLCGPTVYDRGHLGHARSAVSFDVIRKYLRFRGFKVTFVSNYTDIDDKMINRAAQLKISVKALAKKIIPAYQADYAALRIKKPDFSPRATEHIPTMIKIIEKLFKKGFAYEISDGIYFEVKKLKKPGQLKKQKYEELEAGARVEVNPEKRGPHDFVLWKKEKPGEPAWDSPFGRGRPGWHIECSAMNLDLLGPQIDIHAGGADLIFPHHEDEIAQSENYTDKQFAKYWLHNGFIRVNQEKMSKSLGNFFTIEDVLKKYPASVIRFFLISTHYRSPIDYTDKMLEQGAKGLERINDFVRTIKEKNDRKTSPPKLSALIAKYLSNAEKKFIRHMDNDFEVPAALGSFFELIKKINIYEQKSGLSAKDRTAILKFLKKIDAVFSIIDFSETEIPAGIQKLIEKRSSARAQKNWSEADRLRQEISRRGYQLEDSPSGIICKKIC